jgi:hypothetical protein
MLNNQSILDTRKLITGKDGQLFVEHPETGDMIFLAEVNNFSVAMNVSNTDYQPVGSVLVYGVPTGVSFTLTFTEALVREDVTMKPILDMIQNGVTPNYTFQGALKRQYDGEETRQILRNCIPDGTFNLMNVTPGEVLQRETSWRINSFPEYQSYFKTA